MSLDGAFSSSSGRPLSPLHGLLEGHDEGLLAVEQEGRGRRQLGPRVAGVADDAVALCKGRHIRIITGNATDCRHRKMV